jgi:hypothetical protein
MDVKKLIKERLKQYKDGEIGREKLYEFAIEMLHGILKDTAMYVKYLEVWGIITRLTEIKDLSIEQCDEQVHKFYRILSGSEEESFAYLMQIPKKLVENRLLHTREILQKYLTKRQLTEDDIAELEKITKKRFAINTLNDLLAMEIVDLLNGGYEFYENEIAFNLKSSLFVNDDVLVSLEEKLLNKLILLLQCYNGDECFFVHVFFVNGIGHVSVNELR